MIRYCHVRISSHELEEKRVCSSGLNLIRKYLYKFLSEHTYAVYSYPRYSLHVRMYNCLIAKKYSSVGTETKRYLVWVW